MASLNTYQTTVIAFLDISGLKEAVQDSLKKPERANKIESMLLGLQNRCTELNNSQQWGPTFPNLKARAFSDSVLLTCPIDSKNSTMSDNALRKIAVISSAFQVEAATVYDFFIRGAITVGLHCDRDDVFFGPAFIEAYEAEKQLANWLRIIVLPKALDLRAHGHHPYLITDDTGITYVDYLHLCTVNLLLQSKGPEKRQSGLHSLSWISLIEQHKTALEKAVKKLNVDSPQSLVTLSKYHSLAHYHNWYLRQVMRGPSKDFPLIELLESALSHKKGMTKKRMAKEIAEATGLLSQIDEILNKRLKNCLINIPSTFSPLRCRGAKKYIIS